MDIFYNSPALAQRPKTLKTDCVGTPCLSRKDVPQTVKELKKGELVAQHLGPVSVLKWKNKKEVTMISTYHGEETRMKLTKCTKIMEGRRQCFGVPNVKQPCVEECFKAFHTKLNF